MTIYILHFLLYTLAKLNYYLREYIHLPNPYTPAEYDTRLFLYGI